MSGPDIDPATVVELLYRTLLRREYDPDGHAMRLGRLQTGKIGVGSVGIWQALSGLGILTGRDN
jgi:hypothetical protein